MKKLLMILPHCSTGGLPQYAVKKIELLKEEYRIIVIDYSNSGGEVFAVQKNKIRDLGVELIVLGEDKLELLDIIDEFKPDIIHMEEMPEYFLNEEIAKEIYLEDDRPFIVETTHDSSFNPDDKVFFPDHFSFVSTYSLKQFEKLNIPMSLIEYPVEKNVRPDRTESLIKLGLDPNKLHILNVGLFTPRKNQAEVFQYAKELLKFPFEFHFVGNQASNFESYWKPLLDNKLDNCKIWGERSDVDTFYSCMDLLLFTSRGHEKDKETNPLVIKEALSWDLPILLYNLPVYLDKYEHNDKITYLKEESFRGDIISKEVLEYNINLIKKSNLKGNKDMNAFELYWNESHNIGVNVYQIKSEFNDLCDEIEKLKSRKYALEIGINQGGTSYILSHYFTELYSIDIETFNTWEKIKEERNNINFIQADSHKQETIDKIKNLNIKFDFIFINGDHSESGATQDLIYYSQFLNENGIIAFHDIRKDCISHQEYGCYIDYLWLKLKNDIKYKEFLNPHSNWAGIGVIYPEVNYNFSQYLDKQYVVVSTHPSDDIKTYITLECVKQLKYLGLNVILSSHIKVSDELKSLCDYVVYNDNNTVINGVYTAYNINNDYKLELSTYNSYGFGVLHNYLAGASFAKDLNINNLFFMNYDWIVKNEDYIKINEIVNKVKENNFYGFVCQDLFDKNTNDYSINTALNYFNIDYYLDKFSNITTIEKYKEKSNGSDFLEDLYYSVLKDDLYNFHIINGVENIIPNSSINLCGSWDDILLIPVNKENNNKYFLPYISNYLNIKDVIPNMKIYIDVYNNTKKIYSFNSNTFVIFKIDNNDNYSINYKILLDDKILYDSVKTINMNNYDSILKNGSMTINENKIYKFLHNTMINNSENIILFYEKSENKLHITNKNETTVFNIKIRTKDNYEYYDSINDKTFEKDTNWWFLIGNPLNFHHKEIELVVDFYDENYNYLFTKETNPIEDKKINNRYFVSFTDENMLDISEYLVKSLNVFSDDKIILYSVNCDIPFNYPNLIKRRIDYNIKDVIFLKPYIILESLKEVENAIFIDADVIVNYNINDLWNFHKEINNFPLFTSGPWKTSILYSKPNPNTTILSKYKQSLYPLILPYVQTNLFVYNNSNENKKIFEEWNDMCLDESNYSLIKEEYFIFDESLLNVLLKKHKCNVCLPYKLVNTYVKSDIEFINNYIPMEHTKSLNMYGEYYPTNKEISESYSKIPLNKKEIVAFHGCKKIDKLKEIYDYVLEYNNINDKENNNSKFNNDLFVISSYVNSFEKSKILRECVKSLKQNNATVLLTSHLDDEQSAHFDIIRDFVDCYLYDPNNISVRCGQIESFFYNNEYGVVYTTNETFGYAVLTNFLNGAKKAKQLGYKYAYFMNYDFVINDSDITDILNIKKIINNYKGYFFHTNMSSTDAIKTTFYYANVDFIIETLQTIKTVQDYLSLSGNTGILENLYWNLFHNKKIIMEYSDDKLLYFSNSMINICSSLDRFILFKNKTKENEVVLWFDIKNYYLEYTYKIEVLLNDNIIIQDIISDKNDIKKYYPIEYKENDNIKCNLYVYENDTQINIQELSYKLDKSTLSYISTKGYFDILSSNNKQKDIINKDFNITYNDAENKIFINYTGNDEVEYKVSFKEINSNIPLYFSNMTFFQNSQYWVVPIPSHFIGRLSKLIDFGGLLIEFYDLQNNFIHSIKYRFNDNKYDGIYFKNINPFDTLYVNYHEFFNLGVYDDLLNNELDVVIDLGANNGLFTDYVIHRKNAKKVYAIEPVESAYNSMYERFNDNENIILINKAIYDINGKKEMLIADNCTTVSSFENQEFNYTSKKLIETLTFNKFVTMYNIHKIDLLKVDIEGSEYKVFETITSENLNNINSILLEFHDNNGRLINIINKLTTNGFKYLLRTQGTDSIGSINDNGGILYAYKPKYNIKAVHLLTKPEDEREKKSINNLIQLTKYSEYKQVVNELYTQLPPSINCLRPNYIDKDPGYMKLSPGHYGCYSSHKNGFLDNIDSALDFILIFECDAYIISDMETFIKQCYIANEYCIKYNIPIFSFGSFDKNNSIHIQDNVWKTQNCIEAHAYLIPNSWFDKLKVIWENEKWDVADLFISHHISQKYGTLFYTEPLSHQTKGVSLIDKNYSDKNYLGIDKI